MKLEMAFRIFRKLNRRSADICHVMIIERDMEANPITDPTEVKVKMVPRKKREFSSTELSIINPFCKYHGIKYVKCKSTGELVWESIKKPTGKRIVGKVRFGRM